MIPHGKKCNESALLNVIIKLSSIIALCLLIYVTIFVNNSPALSYEYSIYLALPKFIWIMLIFSIILGHSIVLFYFIKNKYSILGVIGIYISTYAYLIICLLPLLRNYAFYGNEDPLTHVGFLKDIILTGHISKDNFYPLAHILTSILYIVPNASYLRIMELIPIVFSLISLLFSFLLINIFTNYDKVKSMIMISICMIPILLGYHTLFTPGGLTVLIIPIVLFLYFSFMERVQSEKSLLLIIYLLAIPFYHLFVAFLIIYFLFSMYVYAHMFYKMQSKIKIKKPLNLILISFTGTFIWFSSSIIWSNSISRMVNWLAGLSTNLPFDRATGQISNASNYYDLYELIPVFLTWTGSYLILGVIALIGCIPMLLHKKGKDKIDFLIFYIFISTAMFSALLFFVFPTGVDPLRPIRFLAFPLQLFAGITLCAIISKTKRLKHLILFLIIISILISSYIAVFNIHYSPYLLRPTEHVTNAEFSGMKWLLDNKDLDIKHCGITSKVRFCDALLGITKSSIRKDFPMSYMNESYIGDHFSKVLSNNLSDDKYITLSKYDEYLYIKVWPKTNRFNSSDFKLIQWKSSLNFIYNNREFKSFLWMN